MSKRTNLTAAAAAARGTQKAAPSEADDALTPERERGDALRSLSRFAEIGNEALMHGALTQYVEMGAR